MREINLTDVISSWVSRSQAIAEIMETGDDVEENIWTYGQRTLDCISTWWEMVSAIHTSSPQPTEQPESSLNWDFMDDSSFFFGSNFDFIKETYT